jgi:hypothetical protein
MHNGHSQCNAATLAVENPMSDRYFGEKVVDIRRIARCLREQALMTSLPAYAEMMAHAAVDLEEQAEQLERKAQVRSHT